MAHYLVIVESPAKVKTIKKFLGSSYTVDASQGHVRDLPKSQLGVDVEHDYDPKYITIRGKGDILAKLRKEAKKADKVYLATDPDREGEAISWHLAAALKLDSKKMRRITFNEITKNAVKASLKHPRDIDMNLVDAQQARRVLDRMVGYRISPLLWAKVKRGLSAGRVQSVALRLIADREEEIDAFIPEEYWSLDAILKVEGEKRPLTAKFYGTEKEKITIHSEEEMDKIRKELEKEHFSITNIKQSERLRKAPLPFTTSTLQQEAAKALNFGTQKTMRIAQQLYEGIDIKGNGTVGVITYLRTDSTRIAEEADAAAREYIAETYGKEYVIEQTGTKKTEKKIQDAHEAIRPTDITRTPASLKESLSRDQFRLYQLIWKRFAASRMQPARYETTAVKIGAGKYVFTVTTSKIAFQGFRSVYTEADEEKEENNVLVGGLKEDSRLEKEEFDAKQHFTQPPAHYTEATLVKALEELGIGRPSTYAPTISTILGRRYITKEAKNLYITEIGEVVNSIMKRSFPSIVDVNFTANMEGLLDMVEEGKVAWKDVIRNFYPDLNEAVNTAEKELESVKIEDEVTDVVCEECGRNMVIKYGPHGKFLACPGFPECRNTKPYLEKIGVACPLCGKEVVIRKTKKGRKYYGCENNPECEFMSWQKPSKEKCPECGKYMVEKGNKLVCSDEKCGYVRELKKI
ncbi:MULTISPECIES: type I DNA topoisomerase [Lachnospiraceae]|uniref:DNA topoisomerase 1 n=1 Tax=Faecalicatena acetigenes TaxID=2981790 RepID=A0ABT2TCB2_9FIRM|nr:MULTISPECIES: type I DNA topoisomerase [Lachnospiraceae]MCU6747918.1 type I DNA topoisomerase [Faecalicatena acetigenes]RGT72694.1 type I DNA topoisomerase [Ruminococcus sp. AF18-22]SCI16974.1 DNA topoisomerase 1 [uncultured Clostridium sp.]